MLYAISPKSASRLERFGCLPPGAIRLRSEAIHPFDSFTSWFNSAFGTAMSLNARRTNYQTQPIPFLNTRPNLN